MTDDVAGRVACMLAWLGLAALPGSGLASATLAPAKDPRPELPASFLGVLPGPDRNDMPAHLDLSGDGKLHATDVRRGLHGMFRYLADAATFEECLTGRAYPVAMEGDYLALERAYVALPDRAPGAAVMASFDGDITQRPPMEGSGTVPTIVVRRFIGLWPDQSCERAMSHASLAPQYWRIVSLRGEALPYMDGAREPHLVLRGTAGGYRANAGGQPLDGQYRVAGTGIEFEPPDTPGDACPPAHRARQGRLLEVLAAARTWSIQGQVLELLDAAGTPVAVLEAVYLR
jgi:hypothetical protein